MSFNFFSQVELNSIERSAIMLSYVNIHIRNIIHTHCDEKPFAFAIKKHFVKYLITVRLISPMSMFTKSGKNIDKNILYKESWKPTNKQRTSSQVFPWFLI